MPQSPPEGMPHLTPMLFYEDVAGALESLQKAFGFSEAMRIPGPEGAIMHAEMTLGAARIMLGPAQPDNGMQSAAKLGGVNQSLYVFVDDVDAHCAQARTAGATIVSEPEDMFWGDRMYYAQDAEGHHWNFATHVKDVAPEDMKPPTG